MHSNENVFLGPHSVSFPWKTTLVSYLQQQQMLTYLFCSQLRYLQTLNSISVEQNSTIIFPFPISVTA